MSYTTDRYTLKKSAGQSLAVVECGIQICHRGHATPPIRYRDYSAHFILEGKGVYILNGRSYPLQTGQGFLITPGADCTYRADDREPWKYIYASFRGVDDEALVHSAGLDEENVIFSFDLEEAEPMLYRLHAAGKQNEARGYDVTGWFLLVMSGLVRAKLGRTEHGTPQERYIRRAKQYIEDNYPFEVTVERIAAHVGLERSYLYRLFREQVGCSPSRYLRQFRLERAAALLRESELPIAEIGLQVGFADLSHFYRAFSEKYKTSPKRFREASGSK